MRLSTPPLIFLSLLGSAALIRPHVDEYLDERANHRVIVEMAERGRLRAETEIASGCLEWPDPISDPVVASEWCVRYGVYTVYVPPYQPYLYGYMPSPSEAQWVEIDVYRRLVRAHISRVVGEDAISVMGWLRHDRDELGLTRDWPTPPNPGMQRTRYARR